VRLQWIWFIYALVVLISLLSISVSDVYADVHIPKTDMNVLSQAAPRWDGTLRRIRVPVLMYHYVGDLPANADRIRRDLTVSTSLLRVHLEYLQTQQYTPISLYDLENALQQGGALPTRPIVLTFDDGYIDHYLNVFPVLQNAGYFGTFFIITGQADANDPRYVSWEQIREMAEGGMSMEAHTKNHAELDNRDYNFLVYEMLGSMQSLEAYTGSMPHMFAYPVGRYDETTLQVALQLPIWRAFTTEMGSYHTTDNRLEMSRIRIHNTTSVGQLEFLLQNY
jgi:peptidoglycan/xylan/chitin deacetylase (PgdA/CDA1 family)